MVKKALITTILIIYLLIGGLFNSVALANTETIESLKVCNLLSDSGKENNLWLALTGVKAAGSDNCIDILNLKNPDVFNTFNTVQHAYDRHSLQINRFKNKVKSKETLNEFAKFCDDIISDSSYTYEDKRGSTKIKGYYKYIDGQHIGVEVYSEGKYKDKLATVLNLSENQLKKNNIPIK